MREGQKRGRGNSEEGKGETGEVGKKERRQRNGRGEGERVKIFGMCIIIA